MALIALLVFIVGYVVIAFEQPLRLNKAAPALLTGVLCWMLYFLSQYEKEKAQDELLHHFGELSSILFFLLGAMTIVELIDSHNGFDSITNKIKTRSKSNLLWIIGFTAFFLSAMLDNLTTAIVMTSLSAKLLNEREDRLWFAGIIIIAANAGGVFSPLGDVTTTMLWIGGQVSAGALISKLFLPSLLVCILPLFIVSLRFKNQKFAFEATETSVTSKREANLILTLSLGLLLFVPVFKMLTHLPPFMGVLLALGVLWIAVSFIHAHKPADEKEKFNVSNALQKIDSPSILFFLGILLAVSALQSFGLLNQLAILMTDTLRNDYAIGTCLGLVSALVDNVPLVAATQGMFDMTTYPLNHPFWLFLALTTGTGGSAVIIGSAAGVAAMGIEQIPFAWYLKKISWLALMGFAAGIGCFLLLI